MFTLTLSSIDRSWVSRGPYFHNSVSLHCTSQSTDFVTRFSCPSGFLFLTIRRFSPGSSSSSILYITSLSSRPRFLSDAHHCMVLYHVHYSLTHACFFPLLQ